MEEENEGERVLGKAIISPYKTILQNAGIEAILYLLKMETELM